MIRFRCKSCGQKIKVSDEYIGKKGRCPKCREVNIVPNISEELVGPDDWQVAGRAQDTSQAPDAPANNEPYKLAEETKQCPYCGESIPETAKKCEHCGGSLDDVSVQAAAVIRGAGAYGGYGETSGQYEFYYAGFWRRFAALIVDWVVLAAGGCIVGAIFGGVIGAFLGAAGTDMATIQEVCGFVGNIAGIVVSWLYFTLLECSSRQATLGKMALGIIVTDMGGNKVSFGRANGRYWGKIISGMILGIGYIMAGFTARKQALHDMMAGCLVVKK